MGLGKRVFTRNNGSQKGGSLYKWSPSPTDKRGGRVGQDVPYYCNATPRSQGEDWFVRYVYDILVVNGTQKRIAYVACDYVQ
jgi:hypothetical protein